MNRLLAITLGASALLLYAGDPPPAVSSASPSLPSTPTPAASAAPTLDEPRPIKGTQDQTEEEYCRRKIDHLIGDPVLDSTIREVLWAEGSPSLLEVLSAADAPDLRESFGATHDDERQATQALECGPNKELTWSETRSGFICCFSEQDEEHGECVGTPSPCPKGWSARHNHCAPRTPRGMAYIPSGVFMMGPFSTDYDGAMSPVSHDHDDLLVERCFEPQEMRVEAFFIDLHEVSTADYTRCVKAGRCTTPQRGDASLNYGKPSRRDHPINGVSFEQAARYCRWRGKRLPTSKEWEKAARGDLGADFAWGDDEPDCTRAISHACSPHGTLASGKHPEGVSPYGLHNTAGNVSE